MVAPQRRGEAYILGVALAVAILAAALAVLPGFPPAGGPHELGGPAGGGRVGADQAPPSLPATIYGNVSIVCQSNGSLKPAPRGLHVYAVAPNGTVLAGTSTGNGTVEPSAYQLSVENYSGAVYLFVEGVNATSVEVSPGDIVRVDILVNESDPPGPPGNLTVEPAYSPKPNITWSEPEENLAVAGYTLVLSNSSGVLYNVTLNSGETSWSPPDSLADGVYQVAVSAFDLSCNQGPEAATAFTVDTTPPSLVSATPGNGSYLAESEVWVNLTFTDISPALAANLSIDGSQVNASVEGLGGGLWLVYYHASLADGGHEVEALVWDDAGNAVTVVLEFTVDTATPQVELYSGPIGSWTSQASGSIVFVVSDETSGVDWASVEADIDGQPASVTVDPSTGRVTVSYSVGEGWHLLHLAVSDAAGNTAHYTGGFGVDQTPPTIDVEAPSEGERLGYNDVCINATVSDGLSGVDWSTLQVTISGYGSVPATYNPSTGAVQACASLNDGNYTATITVSDQAGNPATATVSFTVATGAPSVEVEEPEPSSVVAGPSVYVNITVSDDSGLENVTVLLDGSVLDSCSCNGETEWSYQGTLALDEGSHEIEVYAENVFGRNRTVTVDFTVDNTPPTVELQAPPPGGLFVNETSYCIAGTVSDGIGVDPSTITLLVDGTPVDASYNESTGTVEACVTLGPGNHTVELEASDLAGHTSTATGWLVVDLEPPAVNVYSPEGGALYPEAGVEVNLTASDDWSLSMVEVYIDGELVFSGGGPGPVSYYDTVTLGDGGHQLYVVAADEAGNSIVETVEFTVDTEPPSIDVVQPSNGSVLSTGEVSLVASIGDEVSGVNPASIGVYVDGEAYTGYTYSSGLLTATLTLGSGGHNVTVTAADQAGHQARAVVLFTVDLEAPSVSLEPEAGSYLPGPTVSLSASASDDAGLVEVRVYLDGSLLDSCQCTGRTYSNSWTLTLDDGQHNLTIVATDVGGSTARAASLFYSDSQPPVVEVQGPPNGSYQASLPVCVEATISDNVKLNDSSIQVLLDGQQVGYDYNPATGSLEACLTPSDGQHTVEILAGDMAGHTASATLAFTVDTTPPEVEAILPEPGSLLPSAAVNLTVTLSDNIGLANATIEWPGGSVVIPLNGSLEASPTVEVELPDGASTVMVTVEDLAGHTVEAEAAYTVDTTPPSISVESPANGSILASPTVALQAALADSVSGVDPASIGVYVDGEAYTGYTYDPSTGSLQATLTLTAGWHNVTLEAADQAGHQARAVVLFTVDPYPPQASLPASVVANTSTVELQAEAWDNVTWLVQASIYVDGSLCCTYNISTPSWEAAVNLTLAEGVHTVALRVVDAAGNEASAESVVIVDQTPPQLVSASPPNGTVARPGELGSAVLVVSETLTNVTAVEAELNGVQLGVNLTPVGGGIYEVAVPIPQDALVPGGNTLLVAVQDAAGNTLHAAIVFYVDYYPPTVEIVEPVENVPGAYVSNTTNVTLVAVVADNDTWIDTVSLYVDGSPAGFNYENGTLTAQLQLEEGQHIVTLTAVDAAGRTSTETIQVVVDLTPPTLALESPPNGSLAASAVVNVSFTIIEASGYLQAVNATVNGAPANVSLAKLSQGLYEAVVTVNASVGGVYAVTLTAADAAGHESSAMMVLYADWQPPALQAQAQYIIPPGESTLRLVAWDDAIEALQMLGVTPEVSGPLELVEWMPNGTLILAARGLQPATPVEASVSLTDLQGRTATAVFYLVNGTPATFNLTIPAGSAELASLPIGVVPQVLEEALGAACPNASVYQVYPDWSLAPGVGEAWAPAVLVDARNSTGACTLSYTGYTLPVNASYIARWSPDGSTAVVVPLKPNLTLGSLGLADTILYTIDPQTGRWRVAAWGWAGTLGSLDRLEPGRAYLAARLPGAQQAGAHAAPEALQGGVGTLSDPRSPAAAAGAATAALAGLVAVAVAPRRRLSALAAALLLAAAPLLGVLAAGQEASVLATPPESVAVEPGGLVNLTFEAEYSSSYQSLVLLDLRLPEGFSLASVEVVMEGQQQSPQVAVSGGNVSILVEDLQPPNGRLTLAVTLEAPASEGSYSVEWRFTVQAMAQLSPQPPLTVQGGTSVEVSAPPSTTTTTTATTSTTQGTTSPQATTTSPAGTASATTPQQTSRPTATQTQATTSTPTATQPTTHPTTPQHTQTPSPTTTSTAGKGGGGTGKLAAAVAALVVVAIVALLALRRR